MEKKEKNLNSKWYFRMWMQIKMFFVSIFGIKGFNGQRRLVRNPITGKFNWTKGEEIKDVYTADINVENSSNAIVSQEHLKEEGERFSEFPVFEPKIRNRFILNFPGIEPYFIRTYKFYGNFSKRKMSNGKTKVRELSSIEFYLPANMDLELDILKKSKSKNIGSVTISVVNPVGEVLREVNLSNAKIERITMYDLLTQNDAEGGSDILTAVVEFSHDERRFV